MVTIWVNLKIYCFKYFSWLSLNSNQNSTVLATSEIQRLLLLVLQTWHLPCFFLYRLKTFLFWSKLWKQQNHFYFLPHPVLFSLISPITTPNVGESTKRIMRRGRVDFLLFGDGSNLEHTFCIYNNYFNYLKKYPTQKTAIVKLCVGH